MSKITVGDKTYRCLDGWYQEYGDRLVKVTSVEAEVLDEIERLQDAINRTITDMQSICNVTDDETVIEIANHVADELGKLLAARAEVGK